MKCLCLHGFLSSSAHFRIKTAAVRRLAKDLDMVYIDAPFRLSITEGNFLATTADGIACRVPIAYTGLQVSDEQDGTQRYGWFLSFPLLNPDHELVPTSREFVGIQHIHQPFFASMAGETFTHILGFSQAATILIDMIFHFMLIVSQDAWQPSPYYMQDDLLAFFDGVDHIALASPWFPVIDSGESEACLSPTSEQLGDRAFIFEIVSYYRKHGPLTVHLPFEVTLICGSTDQVVPVCGMKLLAEIFPAWRCIQHDGGHFIPSSGALKGFWRDTFVCGSDHHDKHAAT